MNPMQLDERPNKNYIWSYDSQELLMKLSDRIKPISYLKSHAAEIVDELTETREPLIVTQNGEAKLVVMDIKSFEEMEQTKAMLKILALGRKQIEEGKFYPLEDVLAELEKD